MTSVVTTLEKIPMETRATDALRELIVSGTIRPGSRITEVGLSGDMQISRATIRAALHKLVTEGLVLRVPYTGWAVVALTPHDVWELYTLRSGLERLAAQLVARNVTDKQASAMQEALQALIRECERGNRNRIAETDFNLHKTIVMQAAHGRLETQYRLIEQQTRMYIRSSDALIATPSIIIDQHKPIVAAILAGNPKLAGQLSEEHNLTEGAKLADHLRKQAMILLQKTKKNTKVSSKPSRQRRVS
ncbi:GntR family transcriptional regulator [Tardiphaga robiniae]|uniref:GntR family transcriptional regulator n=1 Tax=Tardiphaga robiniae TaxID=943830 RepID=A0A7G6U1J0_9BRAD|nr:GntR family transcriptional regulator [Tardiphaga robiniae]QND72872.1 GntR family transcriptional regulator [Tardiphaga robiniae]